MTTQQPPQTPQPTAIGPLTGEVIWEIAKEHGGSRAESWNESGSQNYYEDIAASLNALIWPPAPPPVPVLRAWTAEEMAKHAHYWFRLQANGSNVWYRVESSDCIGVPALRFCEKWRYTPELLEEWECTAEPWPGGNIEPCGVMEGGAE